MIQFFPQILHRGVKNREASREAGLSLLAPLCRLRCFADNFVTDIGIDVEGLYERSSVDEV